MSSWPEPPRGGTTVRICAVANLLLRSGLDATALHLGPLGGGKAIDSWLYLHYGAWEQAMYETG